MQLVRGVFVFFCLTAIARADGGDSAARQVARDHYRKGSVAYELGHYAVAIAEYEAAYQAYNEPTLLYNLGQAHRLAGHLPEAVHFYRMYLLKVPDASNRADVEARIASLQSAIAQSSPAKVASPPSPPPVTTAPTRAPAAAVEKPTGEPSTAPAPIVSSPADRSRGRGLEVGGIVVGVAGLGLIAGGIGAGVLSQNAANDISRADLNHQSYDAGKYTTYQNDRVVEGVLIGVGAAAVVTGTVLAIVGVKRHRVASTVQIVPAASPGRASLTANLRF